ncbi:uncharacterized protein LOC121369056 [Gigantopelta aegis]|uniref:uncharacterized protein LOC121369056 n=1 Tax=Gigantopelta aegis TaxID=1735272 RepID=UPI001B888EF9|nr:uncharacterized protein LOC121369056 [Gigantopelta aegis]XP_041349815.1 uncharacterized protein LOC121369056 [Gigantopelta aegis]
MTKRKEAFPLSEYPRLVHVKDKKDIEEICALCVSLWQDHCRPNKRNIYRMFVQTKRYFLLVYVDVKDLQLKVEKTQQDTQKLSTLVMEVWAFSGRAWTELAKQLTDLRTTIAFIPEEQSDVKQSKTVTKRVSDLEEELPDLELADIDLLDNG